MMNIRSRGLRAVTVLLTFGACAATASAATDRVTGLPLFAGTTQPMDASDPDFCGSAKKGMNYTLNTDAPDVLGWYKTKLRGFRYEHVKLPDGHTFEAFVSNDGKQIVEVYQGTGDGSHKYFDNLFYFELTPGVDPNRLSTELKKELPC
ncbi:MAG: hypothetical protein IAI50_02515 [Candidatus Eremiobacteraeota bacterium]|nr:hypothetical protein [Candidatus Eremiobacteraeota bacterium]